MTIHSYEEFLSECHDKIRAGNADLVVKNLRQVNTSQIPRKHALAMAALCRRTELIQTGLRILRPIVNGPTQKKNDVSDGEKGEYAVLLLKNGSIAEARRILKDLQNSSFQEAHLYLGFAAIMVWDYEKAVQHLKLFIEKAPDSFIKLVAKVNMSAALINTYEYEQAKKLISENMEEANKFENKKLLANCHELMSQVYTAEKQFEKARESLDVSWQILKQENSTDQLFVVKQKAIIDAISTGSTAPLLLAKQEAIKRRHWESVRDLDFHLLKLHFNSKDYNKLYCGTPHAAYRTKLTKQFSSLHALPENAFIGADDAIVLDLNNFQLSNGRISMPSPQIQRTFIALLNDVYRPQSLGALFEKVFPSDYFDADSSPNRIRQLINRTRQWIEENHLPVQIAYSRDGFKVEITGSLQIKLHLDVQNNFEAERTKWFRLQKQMKPAGWFTVNDVCETQHESKSSAQRLLNWALKNNKITKSGSGPSTKYFLSTE